MVNGWRRSGVVLAVATELHESVNANLAGAGLLVANVVDAGLAMEKLLLVDATSDALDESLLDARRATVVHILVIATQGREDEFLQELIRKVIEILGPVGGNELIGPLGAGDVLIGERAGAKRVRGATESGRSTVDTYRIDLVLVQAEHRRNRRILDTLERALLRGTGRGHNHGNHEEKELHL